jgi:glutaconate CoA-transferase subunit A
VSHSADPYRRLVDAPFRTGKRTSLEDAVGHVRAGCAVALGGMTLYRRPVACALAIARAGATGLTLIDYAASIEGDLLIGAGCVATVRSCYFGMDVLGLAPMHRQAAQAGTIHIVEETEATLALGLRAARARVDFMPARILAQTDVRAVRTDLQDVISPYSGESYVAVPAIVPDIAFIHALMADEAGNAVLGSDYGVDADLAAAARRTVVTAERIVETAEIEQSGADVLGGFVDHVVHVPRGAWPTACHPLYETDLPLLADYVEACREGSFEAFVGDRLSPPSVALT